MGGGAYRINGRGERHLNQKFKRGLEYRTMPLDDIAALPIESVVDVDANLFLWIPDCHLVEGHGARIARAWGFEPQRAIVWAKSGYGLGRFPRPQHEIMLVCRRGNLRFQVADEGSVQHWGLVYENGARKHSAKPDASLDLIERASPGPYLELFARRARLGWDYWGNESLQTIELADAGVAA